MPRGDGTGPLGTGPVGWGRGPCGAGFARGARRWAGQPANGRGWRLFGGGAPLAAARADADMLKEEAQILRERLAAVEKEISQAQADRKKDS